MAIAVDDGLSLSVPLTSCHTHGPTSRHLLGAPDGSVTVEAVKIPWLSTADLGFTKEGEQPCPVEPAGAAADIMTRKSLPVRHCGRGCRNILRRRGEITVGEIFEQLLAQRMNRRILTRAVHRDIKSDILVQKEVKVGVEVDRISAMADDIEAVPVLVIKSERHRRERRVKMVGR